jgi:hypothetical protein
LDSAADGKPCLTLARTACGLPTSRQRLANFMTVTTVDLLSRCVSFRCLGVDRRLAPKCCFFENVGGAPGPQVLELLAAALTDYSWLHLKLDALDFNGPARYWFD